MDNLIESREGAVQTSPNKDKVPGLSEKWELITLAGGLSVSGNNSFLMVLLWHWYPPYIPLPSSSIFSPWTIISSPWHESNLNTPSVMLIGWYQSHPQIGSSDSLTSLHLNYQPDFPITLKYSRDWVTQAPSWKHSFPPIDITFNGNIILVWPHEFLWGPSRENWNSGLLLSTGFHRESSKYKVKCKDINKDKNLKIFTFYTLFVNLKR